MPSINISHVRKFKEEHPEVLYTERTVLGLLRCNTSSADILARHAVSTKAGWRKPMTS
jgi:hypothetical protein